MNSPVAEKIQGSLVPDPQIDGLMLMQQLPYVGENRQDS